MVFIIPVSQLEWAQNYAPIVLWDSETVPDAGKETDFVQTLGADQVHFYLLSNQDATAGTGSEGMHIQVYDEVNGDYKTVDSVSVEANELKVYTLTFKARRIRILFVPHEEASVDCWVQLE